MLSSALSSAVLGLVATSVTSAHYTQSARDSTFNLSNIHNYNPVLNQKPYARHPPNADCADYIQSVTITSANYEWNDTKFQNNFDVADYVIKSSQTGYLPFSKIVRNETSAYDIGITYCAPKSQHKNVVLLATHGLGFDRRYWASQYKPEEYSFVDHVIESGYSVMFYDRIGTGLSTKLSGFVAQPSIEIEVMAALARSLRGLPDPPSIVLVGHSFGSFTSQVLVGAYPNLVQGVVLTGIGYDTANPGGIFEAFAPRIANALQAANGMWKNRDNGYLSVADIFALVGSFFHPAAYEIPAAEYAQTIAQPFAASELSLLGLLNLNASAFVGPVMIASGEKDLLLCGGDCNTAYAAVSPRLFFPGAKNLTVYLQPNAGHGINFNIGARQTYTETTDFLERNGL